MRLRPMYGTYIATLLGLAQSIENHNLAVSRNSVNTKVTETYRTPNRIVGYDVNWDNIGPKLCAIGTITGENSGIAELASCNK
jgi:hypothetical protein